MDLNFVSVHRNEKNELGKYPVILTSRWVNNACIFDYRKEIQAVQKKNIIYGILRAVRNSYPAMASFLSIVSLWGAGIDLTPAIVFTTSLMFNTLSGNVVEAIIEGAYNFSLIKATFSRLESFLTKRDLQSSPKEASLYNYECGEGKPHGKDLKQEIPASTTNLATPEIKFDGPGIEMKNVCSHIKTKEDSSMISLLNGISLRCNENDLIAITGSSGSGKSSVLGAIIGEIPVTSGEISVTGRIAYMPQNPWLFSGTVQENILFGNDYNEEKYHATIEACALIDDLEHLPIGDMTHVGESGVTLSGGQRARVSLARTVYSDADIFLLDSPLKAVDAKVGESIYKNCISGLLSTRPRIHITHHKKYLSNSTVVLKMENGWIVSRDKSQYEMDEKDVESETKRPTIADGELDKRKDTNIVPSSGNKGISTAEEDRETGSVPIRTYMTFLRAGASSISILFCFLAAFIPGGKSREYVVYDFILEHDDFDFFCNSER